MVVVGQYVDIFKERLRISKDKSPALLTVEALVDLIKEDESETLQGTIEILKALSEQLINNGPSPASIASASELFRRFITMTALDQPDFKSILKKKSKEFLDKTAAAKSKIAAWGHPFIEEGSKILVHGRSSVVLELLSLAATRHKSFSVYITESRPDLSGVQMEKDLSSLGIDTTLILDAAPGYVMEEVSCVLLGAEGVVENGGIINRIGTFGISVLANHLNKPVYVAAESIKFCRLYPLNQLDLPDRYKYSKEVLSLSSDSDDVKVAKGKAHPLVDYTPPSLLTLLFTDVGILTPSAVSDELIKLYT